MAKVECKLTEDRLRVILIVNSGKIVVLSKQEATELINDLKRVLSVQPFRADLSNK